MSEKIFIQVDVNKTGESINPLVFGANFLYWTQDKSSIEDGSSEKILNEMGCRLLRFPGGTVADNYLWREHALHNPSMFPYVCGEEYPDTDDFISFCRKIDAEPVLVVNTESFAYRDAVPEGARYAAEWVRYCNIEKGYNVKYWEIGNETYWGVVMNAHEYAQVFNRYAKEMKAVDPTIILGANGHHDVNFVARKDRMPPDVLEQLLTMRKDITSKDEAKHYMQTMRDNVIYPRTKGENKWWPVIIDDCAENLDMLVIHWYFSERDVNWIKKELLAIKDHLDKETGGDRDRPFFMSEYNVYHEATGCDGFKQMMLLVEGVGDMISAGIDMGAFWPISNKYWGRYKKALYNTQKDRPLPALYALRLLSKNLKGRLLEVSGEQGAHMIASYDEGVADIIISTRKMTESRPIEIDFKGLHPESVRCTQYSAPDVNSFDIEESEADCSMLGGAVVIDASPNTVLHIKASGAPGQ